MGPTSSFDPPSESAALSDPVSAQRFAGFDDSDTPAEVDAAFRSQRRIALGYFAIFVVVLVATVAATTIGSWTTGTRIGASFTPAFLLVSVGLFGFFVVVGLAAALLADAVDARMLGAASLNGTSSSPGEADNDR